MLQKGSLPSLASLGSCGAIADWDIPRLPAAVEGAVVALQVAQQCARTPPPPPSSRLALQSGDHSQHKQLSMAGSSHQ